MAAKRIDVEAAVKAARLDERAKIQEKIRKAVLADAERKAQVLAAARDVYAHGLSNRVRIDSPKQFVRLSDSDAIGSIKRKLRGSRSALSRTVSKGARLSGISEAEIRLKIAEIKERIDPSHKGQAPKNYVYVNVEQPKGVRTGWFAVNPFVMDGTRYVLLGSHDGEYELKLMVSR